MPQPTVEDVHVDAVLSQVSIAFRNSIYIVDRLFPIVPVQKQSDKYYVWTKDFWFRNYVQVRAPGSFFPEGALELSTSPYFCTLYHLGFPIADEERANEDAGVNLEQTAAEWLADQFQLNRESQWVTDFFKTTVWDTDVTGGTNFTQWHDFATSDPVADIQTGIETIQKNTGIVPNKLVVGKEVFNKLRRHPLLLDIYKYTGASNLTLQQVADALQVAELLVGESVQNTAQEGATFSGGYLWGKNALLLFSPATPQVRTPSAGYTFVWEKISGLPITIENIREANRKRDLLAATHAFDQKQTSSDLGYFFSSAVA